MKEKVLLSGRRIGSVTKRVPISEGGQGEEARKIVTEHVPLTEGAGGGKEDVNFGAIVNKYSHNTSNFLTISTL